MCRCLLCNRIVDPGRQRRYDVTLCGCYGNAMRSPTEYKFKIDYYACQNCFSEYGKIVYYDQNLVECKTLEDVSL